jgi:signal transduction histidine kinase/ActR/RegA family two-component response regulator
MLAAVLAHSYTYFLWGHPYGFINFVSEALFVGFFLKQGRRNLIALDGAFWLLLGMPLAWLYHGVFLHMDATTASFIMLKQGVNGVFNAMLVSLAVCFLPLGKLFQPQQSYDRVSLKEYLFDLLVMMVMLPALLLTMLQIRHEKDNLESGIVAELSLMSTSLQLSIHSWFQQHLLAVQELARLAGISSLTPSPGLQHETEILKQTFPDFVGLHVENAGGRSVAFSPKVNERGESTIGHDFSDRRWFQDARVKKQPVVSELIRGRIGVFAPITVIAVPIIREHQFLGTAVGALDLKKVQDLLQPYGRGRIGGITLTDSHHQIIASTDPERLPMQVWDRKKTGLTQSLNAQMYRWYPADPELPSMTRWKKSFYVREIPLGPELPWKLIVEVPVAPLQHSLYAIYVKNLAVMALLIALAMLFSLLLSRTLTRPIEQLSQVTADLPEKLLDVRNLNWPGSSALEINALIVNIQFMAQTLEKYFHNLQAQSNELRQSLSLQSATLESTADGILVVNRQGKIVSANNKFKELWRIPEAIINSGDDERALAYVLDQLTDSQAFLEKVREIYANPALESFHILHFKDGRVFERYSVPQYLDEQIVGRVWSFRDVTTRKRDEAGRLQVSKLESLATLAGGIAHDFNNILTAIMGNIGLAMLDYQRGEHNLERLNEADKACLQAKTLARQLLTFAKGGAPVKESVSLKNIISEAVSFASRGSQVKCNLNSMDNLWAVEVDPGQISQVFQNLVINAVQAMPAGGTLEIHGENLELKTRGNPILNPGRYVKISFQDQGMGIPEEYLPKIFDPYFTTKQSGSGLGLATAYSIIKNHQGHLGVESCLGKGTVFQVYLPASEHVFTAPPADEGEVQKGQGKILVMDDEEIVRKLLGDALGFLGYQVSFAGDGAEALELFIKAQESGKAFDAVILDLTVPAGMGGKETIGKLLEIDPHVKAIVSSGYSEDPIMSEFKKYGFAGVIAKPYKVSELSRVLHAITGNG